MAVKKSRHFDLRDHQIWNVGIVSLSRADRSLWTQKYGLTINYIHTCQVTSQSNATINNHLRLSHEVNHEAFVSRKPWGSGSDAPQEFSGVAVRNAGHHLRVPWVLT